MNPEDESTIKILIIEDDEGFCSEISNSLTQNGYQVSTAPSGKSGLCMASSIKPKVILLDLGLPDIDGCDLLQRLCQASCIPVIVISARTDENVKVDALDLGADDYLTKPFGIKELMARIRVSLRRSGKNAPCLYYKSLDLEIDMRKRTVHLKGENVHLTKIEYHLLSLLAEKSGQVLPYKNIIKEVWGPLMADDMVEKMVDNNRILRVNMANIRRKIEQNPAQPKYVFTEIGVGYRMRENEIWMFYTDEH